MTDGDLFLGLDVGTQGTKGLVVDVAGGAIVARAAQEYGLIEGLPEGAAEQHPDTWIGAVRSVVGRLLGESGIDAVRLGGIGVSGQQHGFVALDEHDAVIRPAKLWCDTATAEEAEDLSDFLGHPVPPGFTAAKILWLKRHEPENYGRLRHVLLPKDYVNLRLTGRRTMEAGDASGTGFFDPAERGFDVQQAVAIDVELPSMLPVLLAPGEPAGTVTAAAAAHFGLPEGLIVAAGGGDNMMSAVGSGATRPGIVVVSLGTSGTVFTYSDRPVIDPDGLIAPFCDSTGGWLPLLCVMNVTGVTEEVRAAFPGADLEGLTAAAARVAPGCGGVLFVPYLQGERVPNLPNASGGILGLRPGLLRPEILFRAALEGTSLNIGWGVERMRKLGIEIDGVRIVGGGARNPLWRSILADVLGAPVMRLAEPESAALGAALTACWTARRAAGDSVTIDSLATDFVRLEGEPVLPDRERVKTYRRLRKQFQEAVEWLFGC